MLSKNMLAIVLLSCINGAAVATNTIRRIRRVKDVSTKETHEHYRNHNHEKTMTSHKRTKSEETFWEQSLQMSSDNTDNDNICYDSTPVDTEAARAALKMFVASLDDATDVEPSRLNRGYRPNANSQETEYHFCTIVQQCLDPPFILSLGLMTPKSRGLAYKAVSKVMSPESFNMLQLQQHSNMLLGEMQDWATTCPGTCRELLDHDGFLQKDYARNKSLADESVEISDASYKKCGELRSTNNTFWYCKDEPRMIHHANINVNTGQYGLGNIWNEPHVHARNSWYDYFSAYGDLEEGGGAFGMRFSGHHIDINYRWNDNGVLVQDTPVFLGHNPLIVPQTIPPMLREPDERADADHFYAPLMWTNMAGVAQFAESEKLILECANELLTMAPKSYVPLSKWTSTGYVGLLQLLDDDIEDLEYYDLSKASTESFNKMWALVEYTLKFSRGRRPTSTERAIFRKEGKAVWTTSVQSGDLSVNQLPLTEEGLRSNLNFLKLKIETDDNIFAVLVNSMYTVVSEYEPTNHMHSVLFEKKLLSEDHACVNKDDPLCIPPERDDHDDH